MTHSALSATNLFAPLLLTNGVHLILPLAQMDVDVNHDRWGGADKVPGYLCIYLTLTEQPGGWSASERSRGTLTATELEAWTPAAQIDLQFDPAALALAKAAMDQIREESGQTRLQQLTAQLSAEDQALLRAHFQTEAGR